MNARDAADAFSLSLGEFAERDQSGLPYTTQENSSGCCCCCLPSVALNSPARFENDPPSLSSPNDLPSDAAAAAATKVWAGDEVYSRGTGGGSESIQEFPLVRNGFRELGQTKCFQCRRCRGHSRVCLSQSACLTDSLSPSFELSADSRSSPRAHHYRRRADYQQRTHLQ